MTIILYQDPESNPCRAVIMAAQHLGIKMDFKRLDLLAGDYLKPEFVEINPQHTVPTIDDDGFILWDSHAIMPYLAFKYAPDSPAYPKDPQQRAVVDRLLYFDIGTLNRSEFDYLVPQIFFDLPPDPEKEEAMKEAFDILEKFLEKTPYVAGDHLTLADFSIVATMASVEVFGGYSLAPYPKISAWMQRMKKEIPNYKEINEDPLREELELLKSISESQDKIGPAHFLREKAMYRKKFLRS